MRKESRRKYEDFNNLTGFKPRIITFRTSPLLEKILKLLQSTGFWETRTDIIYDALYLLFDHIFLKHGNNKRLAFVKLGYVKSVVKSYILNGKLLSNC